MPEDRILMEYMKVREGNSNYYLFPKEDYHLIKRYNLKLGVEKTSIHLFKNSLLKRYLRACKEL